MRVKIHRGTHQVGGTVTEIVTEKARVIIDFGTQLSDRNGVVPSENLEIEGVTKEGTSCDAVLFTHYHGDHTGLMAKILPGVPTYLGKAAKEIFLLQQMHKKNAIYPQIQGMKTYIDGQDFMIGDIRITPILIDHSAFDAYMFLLEGDGHCILHTGDFRTHGYKGDLLLPVLAKYAGRPDVLITEGTNLSVENPTTVEESQLAKTAEILMGRYNYVFALCGATDVDRVNSFYRASVEKEHFFCNAYQQSILNVAERSDLALYNFSRTEKIRQPLPKGSFCMIVGKGEKFRNIMEVYKTDYPEQSLFIYSMTDRYLKGNQEEIEGLREGFPYAVKLHTSGHASKEAIWQVANTIRPSKAIIPIHTTAPEKIRLGTQQEKVVYLEDGEWFQIE